MVLVNEDGAKEDAKEVAESPKVYVVGLPHEITESAVTTFFSNYGKVTDVTFKTATDGKILKGLAYIHFESQESVDKLLEEKTVTIEEKKVHVKKALDDGSKKGEEPKLDVPPQSLKCVVCKKDKFFSVASYLNHRKGKHHQAVLKIFRAKSASVRQLLRAEAKLAADRQYNGRWMQKYPNFNYFCDICQCQIYCSPDTHNLSCEHKLVRNYDLLKCCDIEFTERKKYENHLLSLSHLKKAYEKEQMNKVDSDASLRLSMKKAIDVFKQCDADLKEMKETYEELDLTKELPPFDPTTPIGLNFVVKKINYQCICCDQKFFPNLHLVEPHCRSYNHFCNMQDYILKLEKVHAEKTKKEERESKKEGEPTEDTMNEKQTGKRKNEEPYSPNKKKVIVSTKDASDNKGANSEDAKSESAKTVRDAAEEPEAEPQGAEDVEEMDTVEKSDFNEDDEEEEHVHDVEDESVHDEEENVQDEEENVQGEDVEYDQQDEVGEDEEEPIEDQENEEPMDDQDDDEPNADQEDDELQVEEIEDSQGDDIQEITVVKENKPIEIVVLNEDASEMENPDEDVAKEEEQPVEAEAPKRPQTAIRGRRGRGRGRGMKR